MNLNLPTKLSDVIMQNKNEILALLEHYMNTNTNILFIGSNNTFKSTIINLLVEEYYNKKKSPPPPLGGHIWTFTSKNKNNNKKQNDPTVRLYF
jgi:ribosome biogenesis GTPase A